MAPQVSHTARNDETFQLLKLLGKGAFATTWRARVTDPDLAEYFGAIEVALKVPHAKRQETVLRQELDLNAALFIRLRGIISPNVVRYLGPGVFRGRLVMAMEFVDGGSLRQRFRTAPVKPLPIDECVELTRGILEGVKVIHGENVLHRDLKPENILLADGIPKIADLGLSRILRGSQRGVSHKGTQEYWSPELCEGGTVSFNSDLWAVGVTLYEMLCGRRPFDDSRSIRRMIDLICCGTFRPPCELRPDIPQALSDVIGRALMKDSSDRFQTAEEMLRALEGVSGNADDRVARELATIRNEFGRECSERVETSLRELASRYPRDPRIFHCLGEHFGRVAQIDDALSSYERGVTCDDKNAISHYYLGLAYQRAKQSYKAIASIQRAVELGLEPGFNIAANLALRALKSNLEIQQAFLYR